MKVVLSTLITFIVFVRPTLASVLKTKVKVDETTRNCDGKDLIEGGKHHVTIHYVGKIGKKSKSGEIGAQFDSSYIENNPITFLAGGGKVIKGWDEGLIGLCEGVKAALVIPPEEAFGKAGSLNTIPPDATLEFDVEIIDVSTEGPPIPNLFIGIDTNKDGYLSKDEFLTFIRKNGVDEIPEGLWEAEDTNEDGKISWKEFNGPKGDTEILPVQKVEL